MTGVPNIVEHCLICHVVPIHRIQLHQMCDRTRGVWPHQQNRNLLAVPMLTLPGCHIENYLNAKWCDTFFNFWMHFSALWQIWTIPNFPHVSDNTFNHISARISLWILCEWVTHHNSLRHIPQLSQSKAWDLLLCVTDDLTFWVAHVRPTFIVDDEESSLRMVCVYLAKGSTSLCV